jgi:alpha-L-arabinofuranosidase
LLGDRAKWSAEDGALRQTAEREFVRALAGDKSWTDYTLELKARKISGREGFLILFHILDSEDRNWWNIAGWNNSQHAIELDGTMDPKRGSIETGRWYDIKMTLTGHRIQCWLDGKLMHDIQGSPARVRGLYASSACDKNGDVIVKVVNAAREATDVELALDGTKQIAGEARATVLTSANATDENSIDEPERVSPKTATVKVSAGVIQHTFPANSFTVLRVKSK